MRRGEILETPTPLLNGEKRKCRLDNMAVEVTTHNAWSGAALVLRQTDLFFHYHCTTIIWSLARLERQAFCLVCSAAALI